MSQRPVPQPVPQPAPPPEAQAAPLPAREQEAVADDDPTRLYQRPDDLPELRERQQRARAQLESDPSFMERTVHVARDEQDGPVEETRASRRKQRNAMLVAMAYLVVFGLGVGLTLAATRFLSAMP